MSFQIWPSYFNVKELCLNYSLNLDSCMNDSNLSCLFRYSCERISCLYLLLACRSFSTCSRKLALSRSANYSSASRMQSEALLYFSQLCPLKPYSLRPWVYIILLQYLLSQYVLVRLLLHPAHLLLLKEELSELLLLPGRREPLTLPGCPHPLELAQQLVPVVVLVLPAPHRLHNGMNKYYCVQMGHQFFLQILILDTQQNYREANFLRRLFVKDFDSQLCISWHRDLAQPLTSSSVLPLSCSSISLCQAALPLILFIRQTAEAAIVEFLCSLNLDSRRESSQRYWARHQSFCQREERREQRWTKLRAVVFLTEKSRTSRRDSSISRMSCLEQELADRQIRSLSEGTRQVSQYLAARQRQATPRSCSFGFLTCRLLRNTSTICTTRNRVSGASFILQCTSTSQSISTPLIDQFTSDWHSNRLVGLSTSATSRQRCISWATACRCRSQKLQVLSLAGQRSRLEVIWHEVQTFFEGAGRSLARLRLREGCLVRLRLDISLPNSRSVSPLPVWKEALYFPEKMFITTIIIMNLTANCHQQAGLGSRAGLHSPPPCLF